MLGRVLFSIIVALFFILVGRLPAARRIVAAGVDSAVGRYVKAVAFAGVFFFVKVIVIEVVIVVEVFVVDFFAFDFGVGMVSFFFSVFHISNGRVGYERTVKINICCVHCQLYYL